ncbi:MAG: 50S ribosomal protein L15 [Candidatus Pacebacteria bacterium]|nr:50S ribosomal protein L15 [Candidatus Paceibacterota bacterium]
MQIHELKPKIKVKKKKRVGRGGKRGTYSGKGSKGQKSRAGRRIRPQIRDIIKRLPKKRGYRFNSFKKEIATVNIGDIDKKFNAGEKITPETLLEKKLIKRISKKLPQVKILGNGKIAKKFVFEGCLFSKEAEEKIKSVK